MRTRRGLLQDAGLWGAALQGAGLLGTGLLGTGLPGPARAQAPALDKTQAALVSLLREGGMVMAFRHAVAPGTFDPPGFVLEDCRTQRNLDAVGREQSVRIGQWFTSHRLQPAAVRSSPWCRCLETAGLAFSASRVQTWTALGSPVGTAEQAYPAHQTALRESLARLRSSRGFEVWVTHMFVLQDLVGVGVGSGEALLLRARDPGRPQDRPEVLATWRLPRTLSANTPRPDP